MFTRVCKRGGRYIAHHLHQAGRRTTCSHSHVKQDNCRGIPGLSWKVPKTGTTQNQRQMVTPRNSEPSPYPGSNMIDQKNPTPFFFPSKWFSRSERKYFGGWRQELLIQKLVRKKNKKNKKKSQYICSVNKQTQDHFCHCGDPGETCSFTSSN